MNNWLIDLIKSPSDEDPSYIKMLRSILIFTLLAIVSIIIATSINNFFVEDPYYEPLFVLSPIAVLTLAAIFLLQRGTLWPGKLLIPLGALFAIAFLSYSGRGLHDTSVFAIPLVIILASLLMGGRATSAFTILAIIVLALLGIGDMTRLINHEISQFTQIDDVIIAIVLIALAAGLLRLLLKRLTDTINAGNETNRTLRELQKELEDRVNERTEELAIRSSELEKVNQHNQQRAAQFEAITQVGNAISSIHSLDDLLPKITELISRQFGYYHVGIFLNDANNENTVLSAANSEGGQHMLTHNHQLKIGSQGIVGYVTGTGKPRIALDVGEDAVYFDNPNMPETRSELALPLKIGGSVIGALDVQSKEASAFTEEDIDVLTLLADQVSLAIENARLFDQARKSLAESEALYRQYIRQAWGRLPKEQDLAGFRYSARGTVPITIRDTASDSITIAPDLERASPDDKSPRISVPISIRGETIGLLSVQVPQTKPLNEDQKDLVNAVAERVALSAENARLFEETTRRAERERLVSDITVKIRSTNDPDAMIRTALNELKSALGATHVELIPHTLQQPVSGYEATTQETETSTQRTKKRKGDVK